MQKYNRILSFIINILVILTGAVVVSSCSPKDSEGDLRKNADHITIKNKGSDTMVNLAQAWAERYTSISSQASVEVSGGGSGTGVAALINGTVDIANCSRQIKPKELEQATQNTGKVPQEFIVGYDALAVYVHHDTPIDKITIPQLAEIYGENGTITKWSHLGLTHTACPSDKIIRISRQSNSGTYFYFREALLGTDRDFRIGSLDLHGSKDVVEVIGRTPCAIGYSGMGYATSHVKMLAVAIDLLIRLITRRHLRTSYGKNLSYRPSTYICIPSVNRQAQLKHILIGFCPQKVKILLKNSVSSR